MEPLHNLFDLYLFIILFYVFIVLGHFFLGFPLEVESLQRRGLFETFCDIGEESWNNGMGYLQWLFYLSKYYEFIDTLILIVKKKEPSFLQEYHHIGAVLSMWSLVVTRTGLGYSFLLLNSGVHTIMYAYYASTVYPITRGMLSIVKRYITLMQITQFFIGVIFMAGPIIVALMGIGIGGRTPDEFLNVCTTSVQRYSIFFTFFYLLPLIMLFLSFYVRTYNEGNRNLSKSNNTTKNEKVATPKSTQVPTDKPTQVPTDKPTQVPTDKPTQVPTDKPQDKKD